MEVSYIFYKEQPAFDENIFSANRTENNEIKEIILKKDRTPLFMGLKINQKSEITELNKTLDELLSKKKTLLQKALKIFLLRVKWKWKTYFKQSKILKKS